MENRFSCRTSVTDLTQTITCNGMNVQLPGSTVDTFLYSNGRYWPQAGKPLSLSYSIDRSTSDRFSNRQAQMIEEALKQWSAVTNITFRPVTAKGNLRFSSNQDGGSFAQEATYGFGQALAYVNIKLSSTDPNGKGNRFLFIALHEIGHALRLKHPGNYDSVTGLGLQPFLGYAEDNLTNTVMTYNERAIDPTVPSSERKPIAYPVTPMPYDIAAIQRLYGAKETNPGNSRYRFDRVYSYNQANINRPARSTIWDSTGTDTLNFLDLGNNPTGYYFDINPGGILTETTALNSVSYQPIDNGNNTETIRHFTSEYGTGIAYDTLIENLIGSHSNDIVYGNAVDNDIKGNAGNDNISGGDGNDIIRGDAGDDQLSGQTGEDTLSGGNGNDSLSGGAGDDQLFGDAGDDTLSGDTGKDRLEGGRGDDILEGGVGNDLLIGGQGNDTYIVERSGDVIIELEDAGTDIVYAAVNFALSANIEALTLTGNARYGQGNALGNVIVGNDNNNRLEGLAGDDTLVSGLGRNNRLLGGTGNDTLSGHGVNNTLIGGTGDDILLGRSGRSRMIGGEGADQFGVGAGFDAGSVEDSRDRITDFNRLEGDVIQLSESFLQNLSEDFSRNTIDADMFVLGTAALDSNDYFLYDRTSGTLAVDADGFGQGRAVKIATIAGRAELTYRDLSVS